MVFLRDSGDGCGSRNLSAITRRSASSPSMT
jgi:hypothetical protein